MQIMINTTKLSEKVHTKMMKLMNELDTKWAAQDWIGMQNKCQEIAKLAYVIDELEEIAG